MHNACCWTRDADLGGWAPRTSEGAGSATRSQRVTSWHRQHDTSTALAQSVLPRAALQQRVDDGVIHDRGQREGQTARRAAAGISRQRH